MTLRTVLRQPPLSKQGLFMLDFMTRNPNGLQAAMITSYIDWVEEGVQNRHYFLGQSMADKDALREQLDLLYQIALAGMPVERGTPLVGERESERARQVYTAVKKLL